MIYLLLFMTVCLALAQSPEDQFKSADAHLNRVYKELRAKLNDPQKTELKNLQIAWLKDLYKIADQPREPQKYLTEADQRNKFLAEATMKRTSYLKDLFHQITGISYEQHNEQHELSLTQAESKKADEELNVTYKKLKAQLTQMHSEKLRNEQKKWLISLNNIREFNEFTSEKVKASMTRIRTSELKERIRQKNFDSDKQWEELRKIEDIKFSKEFGLKPVYQSCPYFSDNILAEAENEKYRVFSLSNSNRIYVFDRNSKLLLGECEFLEVDFDGVADQIQFTDGGQYIHARKAAFRGCDQCFFHVPSLLLAMAHTTDREAQFGPLIAPGGYLGAASSRFFTEVLQNAVQQKNGLIFVDQITDRRNWERKNWNWERKDSDFLKNFPVSASRIGLFYTMQDFRGYAEDNIKNKFFDDVKLCSKKGTKFNEIKIEYHYSIRPKCQIEDISIRDGAFVLMRRNDKSFKNLTLNLTTLNLSLTEDAVNHMLQNPTLFGDSLSLHYKDLEVKKINVENDSITCEIDQDKHSCFANITFLDNGQNITVPWSSPQIIFNRENNEHYYFQMARYHHGPKSLLAAYWVNQDKAWNNYKFGLYNPHTEKWIYEGGNGRSARNFSEIRRYWYDPTCGDVWLSEPGTAEFIGDKIEANPASLNLIDGNTGKVKNKLPCDQLFEVFAIVKNHLVGLPRMDEQRFQVWKMEPFSKLFDVVWDDDLNLSFFCTDGFYSTSSKSIKKVAVRSYDHVYPFDQFDLRLNRPDIVLERLGAPEEAIAIAKQLRGKRLKRMGVTEEMLQPDFHLPEVEILSDIPSSTADDELELKVKARDSRYPLDRLRVYVNGVPVNGKEGELLRDTKSQTLERTIPIKLAAGRDKIQVSVLNSAGVESLYANAEVQCTASRPKPTLYAVAMGVSEYANPEWNLKYATKDATDILARIRSKSGSSYCEVKEILLTDREVTKENLGKIRMFLSKAAVDDTVLMFVAGHGLLDSKYDYYFGTSDIDFDNPSGKGIAFEEFDDLLAEIPCLRKSLLIDTCHAGELDEDEKIALVAAQSAPSGQQIAMHPVGARGMNVKAIEGARGRSEWHDRLQGLFVDLRRGSGSTILSSSAGAEYALESSEQRNGLFTYAVLEALDGKEGVDADKDGAVTMTELAEYVKSRVATLTNNKQSPNVRRVNLESDFTLTHE